MLAQDKTAFAQILTSIAELYNKKLSPTLLRLYWLALVRYALPQIQQALQHHVTNADCGQFMPKPADVVRYLEGASETKALTAWQKVCMNAQRIGAYETVVFDDPYIHGVLEAMGGWIKLCHCANKDLPFQMQEFIKRYLGLLPHPPRNYPSRLIGIYEHQQQLTGYLISSPIFCGDPIKAQALLNDSAPSKTLSEL